MVPLPEPPPPTVFQLTDTHRPRHGRGLRGQQARAREFRSLWAKQGSGISCRAAILSPLCPLSKADIGSLIRSQPSGGRYLVLQAKTKFSGIIECFKCCKRREPRGPLLLCSSTLCSPAQGQPSLDALLSKKRKIPYHFRHAVFERTSLGVTGIEAC